jgi:hypothetical protein
MKTLPGAWTDPANTDLFYELFYHRHEQPETARKEPIVLSTVLPHAVNANFDVRGHSLVDKINGKKINQLEDVIAALEESPPGGQHTFEFYPEKSFECLDRSDVGAANAEILKSYGIAKDRRL